MSSENCNQTNNQQQIFPSGFATAPNIMKYPHIQPHTLDEDGKTRKVTANCPPAYNPDQTQSVLRRNARERNRVKQVNSSFCRLRQHIPQSIIADLTKGGGRGPQKKISKVDTLRIAVEYIKRLQNLLEDLNASNSNQPVPQFTSQINANCDSNSSFSSSLSTGSSTPSSYTTIDTPVYYTQPASPLPSLLDANLQVASLNNNYHNSTTLLSPVSLNSYSPPLQHATQLQNSPTSSFNTSLTYNTASFEPATQPIDENLQQHFQHNAQTTPPSAASHYNGNFQLKFEPYDNFSLDEKDCTPDDKELMDCIFLWENQ